MLDMRPGVNAGTKKTSYQLFLELLSTGGITNKLKASYSASTQTLFHKYGKIKEETTMAYSFQPSFCILLT